MKLGVTLGCLVAVLILVVSAVTKFNTLTNRLENMEAAAKAKPVPVDPPPPTKAAPVEVTTAKGEQVTVQPVAIDVTPKELACLKLADGLASSEQDKQYSISLKMDKLKCFQ